MHPAGLELASLTTLKVATSTDFIRVISAAATLAAIIIASTAVFVSVTIAPIRADMRLLRKDVATLSERLTRVETLLEQDVGQSN